MDGDEKILGFPDFCVFFYFERKVLINGGIAGWVN
jgi:hypothetical protein